MESRAHYAPEPAQGIKSNNMKFKRRLETATHPVE